LTWQRHPWRLNSRQNRSSQQELILAAGSAAARILF